MDLNALNDHVLMEGYTICHVRAEVSGQFFTHGQPYSYTAGRTVFDKHEFLVTGPLPAQTMANILAALVERDEAPYGLWVDDVLTVEDYDIKLILADPVACHVAFTLGMPRVLQAVWSGAGSEQQPIFEYGNTLKVEHDPYTDPDDPEGDQQ